MLSRTLLLSALLIASSALASCAPSSANRPIEPIPSKPPELGCPTSLTTKIVPEEKIPDGAGIVAPETEAEITATEAYLQWAQRNQVWGRQGWLIAEQAVRYCEDLERRGRELVIGERPY